METHNARFIEESNEAQPIEDVSACEEFEELVSDYSFNGFLPQQGTIISVGTQLQLVVPTVAFDYCGTNTNTLLENEVTDMEVDQAIPLNDPNLEVGTAIGTSTQTQPNEEIISRRRSQRERKVVILPDFVYLNEAEYNLGDEDDSITYHQAIISTRSNLWKIAMDEELESMRKNIVWNLVSKPSGITKTVGCKWVYKTKRDSLGNIDKHKAQLVAKGFTQREGIDYNETFSPVSTKDSMRVILALTAHLDLELHQMDVKTAFLNGELEEDIYMTQPPGFVERGKELMVL